MARQASASVDISGPFFKVDVEKTLLQNIQKMMQGLADEGATAARANLEAGSGRRALVRMTQDRVADHVIGRVGSRTGKRWWAAAVVQVDNYGMDAATSRSLMAAASVLESRGHPIRKVATKIRQSRAVLQANLTAGME